MKKALTVLTLLLVFIGPAQVAAQSAEIVTQESHNIFEGIFLKVWGQLKALNPSSKQTAQTTQVYTAGIRGAEATDTLLQPYWKDDLTRDEQFLAELSQYNAAQEHMDKGEMEPAVAAFEAFLSQYEGSLLRPNALLAKGLCEAGMGNNDQAKGSLQVFIDENPDHPMIVDARQVVAAL